MRETLLLCFFAVLQPSSASQQSSSRQPVAPVVGDAEPIRILGGVPRDSMILGETPNAPPGYTATGWSLTASTGTAPCVTLAGIPSPRREAPAVEANGKIYVLGGQGAGVAVLATVVEYDPVTDTWTEKQAPMSTPRLNHAGAVANGRIFVLGGSAGSQVLGSVEEYDPVLDQWYPRSPMPTPRDAHAVAVIGERILVLGGIGTDITALASVEEYNTTTNTWRTRAPMRVARQNFAATSLGDRVFVFEGSTDEYNSVSDTWEVRTTSAGGSADWAVAWGDRVFLVAGGSAVNEYDPVSNLFTNRGVFTTFKNDASYTLVDDKIFSLGGSSSIPPAPSERFDLGSWKRLYVYRKN